MICNFSLTIVLVPFEGVRKSIKGDLSWTSWGTRHLNPTYNFQEDHYLRSTCIVYCTTYRRCKQRSSVAALACADHRSRGPVLEFFLLIADLISTERVDPSLSNSVAHIGPQSISQKECRFLQAVHSSQNGKNGAPKLDSI